MNDITNQTKKVNQNEEFQVLARNSLYSGLYNFSLILYSMLYSFFIARLLSIDLWGVLILATAFNLLITQLTRVFPPSIERTLSYYLPKFQVLGQETNMKAFIRSSVILRLAVLIPTYILIVVIFQLFLVDFYINPGLISLLSPLIIFDGFNLLLHNINLSFNKMSINFYLYLTRIVLSLTGLLYCFIFVEYVSVETIAFILIISYLVPFVLNCIINFIRYLKLHNTGEEVLSFKEIQKILTKYGYPLLFNYFLETFWSELQKVGVGTFSTEENVTGFNTAASYSNILRAILSSLNSSLVVSFSRMFTADRDRNYDYFYNLILKYSLFIVSLASGILFLITDFSLIFIYGVDYLQFSLLLKIILIATPFSILIVPFDATILARDKTKILTPIKIFTLGVKLFFFFLFLIYFDVVGAVIGIVLGEVIIFIFYKILHQKVIKIRIRLKIFIIQFSIFFISLFFTVLMENAWLNAFYQNIILNFNLILLKDLPLLSILIFLVSFFSLNFILKIIVKEDMENFESLFKEKGGLNTILRRISKVIKKMAFF